MHGRSTGLGLPKTARAFDGQRLLHALVLEHIGEIIEQQRSPAHSAKVFYAGVDRAFDSFGHSGRLPVASGGAGAVQSRTRLVGFGAGAYFSGLPPPGRRLLPPPQDEHECRQ